MNLDCLEWLDATNGSFQSRFVNEWWLRWVWMWLTVHHDLTVHSPFPLVPPVIYRTRSSARLFESKDNSPLNLNLYPRAFNALQTRRHSRYNILSHIPEIHKRCKQFSIVCIFNLGHNHRCSNFDNHNYFLPTPPCFPHKCRIMHRAFLVCFYRAINPPDKSISRQKPHCPRQ